MAIPSQYQKQYEKLAGPKRDAAQALIAIFSQYGLQSLAGSIIGFLQQGFSGDTITLMLTETPQYKQRFKANDARIKKGLPALSPKEYIETERAYRAVMSQSGMPAGFYDTNADFTRFLENDLSPNELNERVKLWQDVAMKDTSTVNELKRLYGMDANSYAAALINSERALPLLQKGARAVQFAAAARRHGFTVNKDLAEKYGGGAYNVTGEDAEKGFGAIQELQPGTQKLGNIYGETYSVEDAADEVFGGDATAAGKRKKLASRERGTFSDSSRGSTGRASRSTY